MNFIHISHHFTAREDLHAINWTRSQCVASQFSWSSIAPVVSRTSRIRIPLKPWYFSGLFLPSNCLNWKIYCDDHCLLSTLTLFVKYLFLQIVESLQTWISMESLRHHMRLFNWQLLALTNTLINAKIGQQRGSARRTGNTWKKIAGGHARNVRAIINWVESRYKRTLCGACIMKLVCHPRYVYQFGTPFTTNESSRVVSKLLSSPVTNKILIKLVFIFIYLFIYLFSK